MAYYNRDGEKLELKGKRKAYIGRGSCAELFQYQDFILKKYFEYISQYLRLQPKMFDVLKDIDNNHFVKIYDIFVKMTPKEFEIYKYDHFGFVVDAYTEKYYEYDDTNILTESIDYLLENAYELEKLFDIFTDNSIQTEDIKKENAIINKNAIIITDPDCFLKSSLKKHLIKKQNIENLIELIRDICLDSVMSAREDYDSFDPREVEENIKKEFNSISTDEDTEFAHKLSMRLGKVKRPIDYFSRKN